MGSCRSDVQACTHVLHPQPLDAISKKYCPHVIVCYRHQHFGRRPRQEARVACLIKLVGGGRA